MEKTKQKKKKEKKRKINCKINKLWKEDRKGA